MPPQIYRIFFQSLKTRLKQLFEIFFLGNISPPQKHIIVADEEKG